MMAGRSIKVMSRGTAQPSPKIIRWNLDPSLAIGVT